MPNQLLSYLVIFFGLIVLILAIIDKIFGILPKESLPKYKLHPALLTRAEMNFYKAFLEYKKDDNPVFAKIRLADIFSPEAKGKAYISAFNRIKAKHVDFLICDKETLKPIYAIELDDKSHLSEKAQKRDKFVNGVFEQTGLKIVRVQAKKDYSEAYLVSLFELPEPELYVKLTENKVCIKCGASMVLRKAKRGENKGKQFYGCSNYPKCKSIMEIAVEDKENAEVK